MLTFTLTAGLKGKILFDEESRFEFDQLRNFFKVENKSAIFARQYSYAANPYTYCISPLGNYNIGQTNEFIEKCQEFGIKTQIDTSLAEQIYPDLYISELSQVPNTKYIYRDYQERLLQSLCKAGRGVIISPTRSGKSLILARIMS